MISLVRTMTVASAVFVASSLCLSTVRATQPNVVAYIQRLFPETAKPDDVIRIVRNGKPLSLKKGLVDLVPGDQLFVKQGMVNVLLLYTGEVISVSPGMAEAGKPDFEVRSPDVPGLGGKLLALFKSLVGPDRSGRVIPATRGVDSGHCFNKAGGTNQPNEFKIPALFAEKPALAAGNRALFVTWKGRRRSFHRGACQPRTRPGGREGHREGGLRRAVTRRQSDGWPIPVDSGRRKQSCAH